MADIYVKPVYDQLKSEFRSVGGGSSRFDNDFVTATNDAIKKLQRDTDDTLTPTTIDGTDETIAGWDEDYIDVYRWGVRAGLIMMGHRPAREFKDLINQADVQFEQGITDIYFKENNDTQEADTDDETDIIGLGALG